MKRIIALALAFAMFVGIIPSMSVDAAAKKKETVTKAKVEKVTCTASGKVNISFKQKVTYTDELSVTIEDTESKKYDCKVSKKNNALLVVSVKGLVKGHKYIITIKGVVAKGGKEAVTIKKEFFAKGMKTGCKISKITKSGKNFIVLKLKGSAYYKDATVVVKDSEGKEIPAKIIKKAKGTIKVKAEGLKKGKKYIVTVTGVKLKKEKNYSSITKTFIAK